MNILDIIIFIFLAWGSYRGFKKGLIKSIGGIFAWIASIFIAINYHKNLANYLDTKYNLVVSFGQLILKVIPLPSYSIEPGNISTALASTGVYEMALPDFLKRSIILNIDQFLKSGNFTDANISEIISYGLGGTLLKGLSFLALFMITGLIVKIGVSIISRFFAVTPLGPINKLFGMVLGFGISMLIATLVLGLLSPLIMFSSSPGTSTASGIIQASHSFAYLQNLFVWISNHL